MSSRDPREDPQPGDVLRVGVSRRYCRVVLERLYDLDNNVKFMVDGQTYCLSLRNWQYSNRNAEVLHCAD